VFSVYLNTFNGINPSQGLNSLLRSAKLWGSFNGLARFGHPKAIKIAQLRRLGLCSYKDRADFFCK